MWTNGCSPQSGTDKEIIPPKSSSVNPWADGGYLQERWGSKGICIAHPSMGDNAWDLHPLIAPQDLQAAAQELLLKS